MIPKDNIKNLLTMLGFAHDGDACKDLFKCSKSPKGKC